MIGIEGALKWANSQSYLHTKLIKAESGKADSIKETEGDDKPVEKIREKLQRLPYKDQDGNAAKALVCRCDFRNRRRPQPSFGRWYPT